MSICVCLDMVCVCVGVFEVCMYVCVCLGVVCGIGVLGKLRYVFLIIKYSALVDCRDNIFC